MRMKPEGLVNWHPEGGIRNANVPECCNHIIKGVPDIVKQSLEASRGCLGRTIPVQMCMVILIDPTNDFI